MSAADLIYSIRLWAKGNGLIVDVSESGNIAVFSPCRKFRLALSRRISDDPRILVGCGLNPSTADAIEPDRTINKGCGFARRWGCGLFVMLNAHSYRTKSPKIMKAAALDGVDIIGEHNDALIAFILKQLVPTDIPLAAWGANTAPERTAALKKIATEAGVRWRCFGHNKDGTPIHPLYQRWETPLIPYAQEA